MINDMIFQIAVEHCLRNIDGSDREILVSLKDNTIRTYHQLLEVYQALKTDLKAKQKPKTGDVITFP